ncbi:MAG: DUF6658 family protein [Cyanobacteriota bacterium]|nr:DUF6658 family protein [Cyanobacteriota bacterium]
MNALISTIKRIRLKQILGLAFASCLLFVSTACSTIAQATSPPSQTNDPAKAYDVRDASPASGMNNYSDVDPRQGRTGAAVKTKGLKDTTNRNVKRDGDVVENVKEAADEGGKNLKELGRDIKKGARKLPQKTENALDEAGDSAASQVSKLKANLNEAANQAKRSAEATVD